MANQFPEARSQSGYRGLVGASIANTLVPEPRVLYGAVVHLAKTGLTLTLFLIGAGLSRDALRSVGMKPVAQGVILWVVISLVTVVAVRGLS